MSVDLSVDFCGLRFENPFVLAPSPCTDSLDQVAEALKKGWAGVVLKTISFESSNVSRVYPLVTRVEDREGRFIGLQNIDLVTELSLEVLETRIKHLKKYYPSKIIIVSIMGQKKEEWQTLAGSLASAGADMIQCSISCPHGKVSDFGPYVREMDAMGRIAHWVKEVVPKVPVVVKLSPQITDIAGAAQAVKNGGADGVCSVNTLKSMNGVDLNNLIPIPNVGGLSTLGGLSGPALKPVALHCTAEIARKVEIDIAGSGGIMSWQDATEFLLLGAKTLQICTAVLRYGTDIIEQFTKGLSDWMEKKSFLNLSSVVGKSLPYLVDLSQLPRGIQVVSKVKVAKCNRCGLCQAACRAGGYDAIQWDEWGFPQTDKNRCRGCGICRAICSQEAISLVRPYVET